MSRSRKKHSFCSITTAKSEKEEKKIWHRTYRRICKCLIRQGIEDMPHFREYSDPWAMDKDGKYMFDPKDQPKKMRK